MSHSCVFLAPFGIALIGVARLEMSTRYYRSVKVC